MKKFSASTGLAVALCLSVVAPGAFATDGTITFTGKVISATCDIDGNGTGGKDFTVGLKEVQASTLSAVGDVADGEVFSIGLSGADCTSSAASIHFEMGSNVDPTTGNLINTVASGGAGNVQIQITGPNGTPINVATDEGAEFVNIVGNETRLDYRAQYFATAAATAGDVASSVQYSIVYE